MPLQRYTIFYSFHEDHADPAYMVRQTQLGSSLLVMCPQVTQWGILCSKIAVCKNSCDKPKLQKKHLLDLFVTLFISTCADKFCVHTAFTVPSNSFLHHVTLSKFLLSFLQGRVFLCLELDCSEVWSFKLKNKFIDKKDPSGVSIFVPFVFDARSRLVPGFILMLCSHFALSLPILLNMRTEIE